MTLVANGEIIKITDVFLQPFIGLICIHVYFIHTPNLTYIDNFLREICFRHKTIPEYELQITFVRKRH